MWNNPIIVQGVKLMERQIRDKKMKDFIKKLERKERVEKLLKKYSLNYNMVSFLIIALYLEVEPKLVAQKYGLHSRTVKRYYDIISEMPEENRNRILNYFSEGGTTFILK